MKKTRIPEFRANEVKALTEKRAALHAEMQKIIGDAKAEVRGLTEAEATRLNELETEIRGIDTTIAAENRALEIIASAPDESTPAAEQRATEGEASEEAKVSEAERRSFMNYVNKELNLPVEVRSGEQNFNMGNNGAIIPQSIANRIIQEVKEICPILAGVTMYSVKGTLKVPVYGDASGHNITVAYADEFTELTADAGKFTSIDLTGYLVGVLTLIGKNVIANSEIDVFNFIVSEIAKRIAYFLEKELLVGTSGKCTGILSGTNGITAASMTAVTADELIELQSKIPTVYQANACWTMNPKTFTAIKKLKDTTGQYLLQQNNSIVNAFPYTLLGKPVYLSDNMPEAAKSAKAIVYADYSGLSVNMRQQIETQVLNEKYATMHAVGIVSWLEVDSKITEAQKIAVLTMANA